MYVPMLGAIVVGGGIYEGVNSSWISGRGVRRVRGGGGSRNASRSRLSLNANAEDGGVTIGRVPEDVGVDVDVDRDGDRGNDDGDW
jgi:hypothetical protein